MSTSETPKLSEETPDNVVNDKLLPIVRVMEDQGCEMRVVLTSFWDRLISEKVIDPETDQYFVVTAESAEILEAVDSQLRSIAGSLTTIESIDISKYEDYLERPVDTASIIPKPTPDPSIFTEKGANGRIIILKPKIN